MKKAMCYNTLDNNARPVYIINNRCIAAVLFEYARKFDLLHTKEFQSCLHPLEETYFSYTAFDFEQRLNPYLSLIEQFSPLEQDEHFFLAIFITYLDVFEHNFTGYSKFAFEASLEHASYFLDEKSKLKSQLWYEKLKSIALNF